ncbi:MAG: D-glycero-beta-D-manno-heptose-1,7-bisphosphate 7-phosphatase [Piscirickettsiaceae bacterium]|nr:MAG: D-glycero-beta-D-manno-heptose-1,7-bisphosphate 7-phosphatase [Piscirickettsiaceae bacterium]PCI71763.1 MAG: D-glycero-beta-D-manno-heptose-1,7-bisphosphate 7-phosphatase [Piscirickettsiaceae bacterium]
MPYTNSKADIILDRDGVINRDSDEYVKNTDEWIAIENSIGAIAQLHKAGFRVFVATNQSGVGRGFYSVATLHDMHRKMLDLVEEAGGKITDIAFCPHTPDDGCYCRKPKPGLYLDLAKKHDIQLNQSMVIGDSLRDLQAATTVGAKPMLVLTGKGKITLQKHPDNTYPTFENLYDAVQFILS